MDFGEMNEKTKNENFPIHIFTPVNCNRKSFVFVLAFKYTRSKAGKVISIRTCVQQMKEKERGQILTGSESFEERNTLCLLRRWRARSPEGSSSLPT